MERKSEKRNIDEVENKNKKKMRKRKRFTELEEG